ncbi:restriction endonuclease subunit S [Lactobacillus sp. HT06-2]|uniref:restriction endonuclease subunit S n=1 Tax=Lactobacillus sp. HT06-2 TaxID=2080222 RepID=UPI000CD83B46|nr:restriction endonuclease subunit S [Lactobacillus sp. HT06-2]
MEVKKETGTKYIHYGDIHTGKARNILNPRILPNIENKNYIGLKFGDIVVADASEDYKGIADASIVNSKNSSEKIVAGLHTIALRPNPRLYSDFLYLYLSTDYFKHFGFQRGTGLKVFGISYNELTKWQLYLPNVIEQKKISRLIILIEKVISLQHRGVITMKKKQLPKSFPSCQFTFWELTA